MIYRPGRSYSPGVYLPRKTYKMNKDLNCPMCDAFCARPTAHGVVYRHSITQGSYVVSLPRALTGEGGQAYHVQGRTYHCCPVKGYPKLC